MYLFLRSLVPSKYHLSILDIQFREPWTYSGEVRIGAKSVSEIDTIIINADGLDVQAAAVTSVDGNGLNWQIIYSS
jgi:hypothetical protein